MIAPQQQLEQLEKKSLIGCCEFLNYFLTNGVGFLVVISINSSLCSIWEVIQIFFTSPILFVFLRTIILSILRRKAKIVLKIICKTFESRKGNSKRFICNSFCGSLYLLCILSLLQTGPQLDQDTSERISNCCFADNKLYSVLTPPCQFLFLFQLIFLYVPTGKTQLN